jgi:putative sterol carrier protein
MSFGEKKWQSEMCNQMLSDEPKNDKKALSATREKGESINLSVTEKAKLCSDDG